MPQEFELIESPMNIAIEDVIALEKAFSRVRYRGDFPNDCCLVKLTRNCIMADTGCRRAVGGKPWHDEFQQTLRNRGIKYYSVPINERYCFGTGAIYPSVKRWAYPCNPHGRSVTLHIAEIEPDVPGLAGPDEMMIMQVIINFIKRPPTIILGNVEDEIRWSDTRHPIIDLLPETVAHMQIVEVPSQAAAEQGKKSF